MAENLYVSSQENAQPKVLKQFVLNVHSCYMAALQFGKTQCDRMTATKLAEESTVTWLKTLLHSQCSRLAKDLSNAEKDAEEVLVKGLSELKPLPCCIDEKKYREVLATCNANWATKGASLKKQAMDLADALAMVEKISEDLNQVLLETGTLSGLKASAQRLKLLGHSFTGHVTWYACLTLFRSLSVGGTTDQAKKCCSKLQSLLLTFLQTELPNMPVTRTMPKQHVETLVREMEAGVPRRIFSFGISFFACGPTWV